MAQAICVPLYNCLTDTYRYVRPGNSSEYQNFWLSAIGATVRMNDLANYPEDIYVVQSTCNAPPTDEFCQQCFQNMGSAVIANIEFVENLSCEEILPPLNFLINCKANIDTEQRPFVISPDTVLIVTNDLTLYQGGIIKIEEYPDECYSIFIDQNVALEDAELVTVTITERYDDCECCVEKPVVITRTISEPVKDFTISLDEQCYIETTEKFSTNYYNLYLEKAYGINNYCDYQDLLKLWVEKELVDYQKINNNPL
jgi:hypothetical protein